MSVSGNLEFGYEGIGSPRAGFEYRSSFKYYSNINKFKVKHKKNINANNSLLKLNRCNFLLSSVHFLRICLLTKSLYSGRSRTTTC